MIAVSDLHQRYGQHHVLRGVSFQCEPGTVTGFLGPNGAGKSTTMRIIAGLSNPTSGEATVDGRAYRELPNPGRVMGTLIDAQALSSQRTGLENLRLAAAMMQIEKVDLGEVLERVGLTWSAGRKRVGEYSLGMRQRLGIAQALLGRPRCLMLDEPVNGLDPAGILWIRTLLRDFAAEGGTVLLSSHLLHEVRQTADHLVLIHQGEIVARGTVEELTQTGRVLVQAVDQKAMARALTQAGHDVEPGPAGSCRVTASLDEVGRIAHKSGLELRLLRPDDADGLEDLFVRLTSKGAPA